MSSTIDQIRFRSLEFHTKKSMQEDVLTLLKKVDMMAKSVKCIARLNDIEEVKSVAKCALKVLEG